MYIKPDGIEIYIYSQLGPSPQKPNLLQHPTLHGADLLHSLAEILVEKRHKTIKSKPATPGRISRRREAILEIQPRLYHWRKKD